MNFTRLAPSHPAPLEKALASKVSLTTALLILAFASNLRGADDLSSIFAGRRYSLDRVHIPLATEAFPIARLRSAKFASVAKFEWFPEGPTYHAAEDRFYFSGTRALTRVEDDGNLLEILGEPGGGGTHFLRDGSVLIIGRVGLRRLYPNGRIALLADGAKLGKGNDLSMGIHGEVYFSVPGVGIYRLTAGQNGKLQRVSEQGCNGLEVDPTGEYLYVVRRSVERYKIDVASNDLGNSERVYSFPKGKGGGDGCAFDAWGNLYSMRFRTGVIRVIDPARRRLLAEISVGVAPASNLTFGGPANTDLFVTAGAPAKNNCQVLKARLGVTGFCGHVGATEYPSLRYLERSDDANGQVRE